MRQLNKKSTIPNELRQLRDRNYLQYLKEYAKYKNASLGSPLLEASVVTEGVSSESPLKYKGVGSASVATQKKDETK